MTRPPPDQALAEVEDGCEDGAPDTRRAVTGASWHRWRLDQALVALAPEFSRSHLQGLVEQGCVRIDGVQAIRPSQRLQAGQALEVTLRPTAESQAFRPEPISLDIVYQDEHLLVIDKPAGLVVHPAAGNWSGTLLNGVLALDARAAALPRAGIVHRLDKDTSGLMVVGRTLAAVTALSRAIAEREVGRLYLALAHGHLGPPERAIAAPIGRDPVSRVRMAVTPSGRPARTWVEPIGHGAEATAVRCRLDTGRTHQIRVHLSHIGHPLVGDTLYGGRPLLGMARQALHAECLVLRHPITGNALEFRRPPPQDLAQAWKTLTGHALA